MSINQLEANIQFYSDLIGRREEKRRSNAFAKYLSVEQFLKGQYSSLFVHCVDDL